MDYSELNNIFAEIELSGASLLFKEPFAYK